MAGNSQDNINNTYVDGSGVERFRGSNNRVDRSNNSSSSKGSSSGSSGSNRGSSSGNSWKDNRTKNSDGTYTQRFNRDGNTETWIQDANGKLISKSVTKGETAGLATSNTTGNKNYRYDFNDGSSYTGKESNWEDAARKAGNVSGLRNSLSYPDYVDYNEADRYLKEMAGKYNMNLNNPNGNTGKTYTKEEALAAGLVPGFDAPSAATDVSTRNGSSYSATGNGVNAPGFIGLSYDDLLNMYSNAYSAPTSAAMSMANTVQQKFANAQADANAYYDKLNKDAYVAKKMAELNLPQQMQAAGITGGLTESSLLQNEADYRNAYQTNQLQRQKDIRDIQQNEAEYLGNLNTQIAQYEAQARTAAASAYQDMINAQNNYNLTMAQMAQSQNRWEREMLMKQAEAEYNKAMESEDRFYSILGTVAGIAADAEDKATMDKLYGIYGDKLGLEGLSYTPKPKKSSSSSGGSTGGSIRDINSDSADTIIPEEGLNITNRTYKGANGKDYIVIDGKGYPYSAEDIIGLIKSGSLIYDTSKSGLNSLHFAR